MTKEKTLFLVQAAIARFGLGALLWGMPRMLAIASLESEGKEVVAKVVSQTTEKCGRSGTCEVHILSADARTFRIVLPEKHAPGSDVRITYLPADLTIVVGGPRAEPAWKPIWLRFYHQSDDVVWSIIGLLAVLLSAIGILIRWLMRPRSAEPA